MYGHDWKRSRGERGQNGWHVCSLTNMPAIESPGDERPWPSLFWWQEAVAACCSQRVCMDTGAGGASPLRPCFTLCDWACFVPFITIPLIGCRVPGFGCRLPSLSAGCYCI